MSQQLSRRLAVPFLIAAVGAAALPALAGTTRPTASTGPTAEPVALGLHATWRPGARPSVASTWARPASALLTGVTRTTMSDRYVATARSRARVGRIAGPQPGRADKAMTYVDAFPASAASADGSADFDGDGLGDVIELRQTNNTLTVIARRGTDGHRIWSVSAANVFWLTVMRLGPTGRPGLVLLTETDNVVGNRLDFQDVVTLHLTGYTGATGQQLWQTTNRGEVNFLGGQAAAEVALPYFEGVLAGGPRQASRLLISETTAAFVGPFGTGAVQPYVVSGATGQSTRCGDPIAPTGGAWFTPLGDLDKDGFADFAVVERKLVARSSTTGQDLWQRSDLAPQYVAAAPDTTGDGRAEVLAINGDFFAPASALLDGRSGRTVLQAPGFLAPTGDATGDGLTDLTSYRFVDGATSFGVRLVTYAGRTGHVVWRRSITVPFDSSVVFAEIGIGPAGDIQPDTAMETQVETLVVTMSGATSHHDLVDGRTGAVSDGPAIGRPLFTSVDGTGDDFALIADGTSLDITAKDGRTRATIWDFHRTTTARVSLVDLAAAQLTADTHGDVVIVVDSAGAQTIRVLDGASGTSLWSVTG